MSAWAFWSVVVIVGLVLEFLILFFTEGAPDTVFKITSKADRWLNSRIDTWCAKGEVGSLIKSSSGKMTGVFELQQLRLWRNSVIRSLVLLSRAER